MALLLPVLSTVVLVLLLYILEKNTPFGRWDGRLRQAVIGLLFGAIAAVASEVGMNIGGAVINVRDAAPIAAGLIFGAPSGVIAGLIGGAYRWFSVLWGAGMYTRLACSLSTLFAGMIAALLRRYMFDNKRPTWGYGVGVALVCEVLHMLMIFMTNMQDANQAFLIVKQCALPMILGNAVAVGLSTLVVSLLSRERANRRKTQEQISQTFQRWLLVCILIAFTLTSAFTYVLQGEMSEKETEGIITLAIDDVYHDINDASDENLLEIANTIKKTLMESGYTHQANLRRMAHQNHLAEINLIDENGIIIQSTRDEFINYDMANGRQSAEFLVLLEGEVQEYVQQYQPTSYDADLSRKYAAVVLESGGFLQVGYDLMRFQEDIGHFVIGATRNRHIGSNGFITICNEDWEIVSDDGAYAGKDLSVLGLKIDTAAMEEKTVYQADVNGVPHLLAFAFAEGYCIIGAMPLEEAMFMRDASIYNSLFMQIIIFAALFALIYFLIKRVIIDNLRKINSSLSQITDGNLNVTVDVRSNQEFASLSDDINSTVATLKHYIAEAAARIDKELEYAKNIQLSALPSRFPPYPNHREFDIYARMIAAKEVGGDFYDFYMLNENTVAFLAADVSGKGIPAAMFMMTAKTVMKDLAERGLAVNEILTKANEKLCENNESGMFVTAWMGILDLKTGKLQYANAGHNPPLLLQGDSYQYLKSRPGFVLAGMEGIRYRVNELTLQPYDRILLYTDGVTEATDTQEQLYGEERLLQYMNAHRGEDLQQVLHGLKADVDAFVGDAPQFDDMTMLLLEYRSTKGGAIMEERIFQAKDQALRDAMAFVEGNLEQIGCDMKTIMKIAIVVEEVFVNIAHYAYDKGEGEATLGFGFDSRSKMLTLRFKDKGIPFDPLLRPDPNIACSLEDREIGGLGIFICKQTMDDIFYARENGENILTMTKKLETTGEELEA